jgi:hypothetical protein
MTLELPSEIYEAVTGAASNKGLHPAEWIVDNLRHQFVSPPPGSPQAILQALKDAPRVSPEDVDALQQAIIAGKTSLLFITSNGESGICVQLRRSIE